MDARRYAVVWSTDGGDHAYWRHSVASFREAIRGPADFFVFALPSDDLHGVDKEFGLARVDPSPCLAGLGILPDDYVARGGGRSGKWRWPPAIFYKLCAPVEDALSGYSAVLTLDTDTLAMPTSRRYTVDDLLAHPLGDFEVAGSPDLYERHDRTSLVMETMVPDDIREELDARVWSRFGRGCQAYVNAGVLLWNMPEIRKDLPWYRERLRMFWEAECRGRFGFLDQDFVNSMMTVDTGFSMVYNWFTKSGVEADDGECVIRHYCAHNYEKMAQRAEAMGLLTKEEIVKRHGKL
jgi:hypothetical protein